VSGLVELLNGTITVETPILKFSNVNLLVEDLLHIFGALVPQQTEPMMYKFGVMNLQV
jgi:hypothetical protein